MEENLMKKIFKKLNNTLFDVATPGVVLAFYGKQVLIVVAVIVIIFITVKLIIRANKKNQDKIKEDNIEKNDKHK